MTVDTTDRIRRMRCADLRPNPDNPRGPIAPESVRDLADSLAESGMLCPILVRPNGVIVAGHRRHAAATLLGWEWVPVVVTMELDEQAVLLAMVAENLQREDLSPLAEARAYEQLRHAGLSIADIVRRLGVGRERIATALRLLDLDPETAGLADRGDLPAGAIPYLARVTDPVRRLELAAEVAAYRLGLKGLALKVAEIVSGRDGEKKARRHLQAVTSTPDAPGSEIAASADYTSGASGRCLTCQENRTQLIAAMAALTRAEGVIRDNLADAYVPARPAILQEVRRA